MPGFAGCELDAGGRDASELRAKAGSDELGSELLAGCCSECAGSSFICSRQPCCSKTITLPSNARRQYDCCFRRSASFLSKPQQVATSKTRTTCKSRNKPLLTSGAGGPHAPLAARESRARAPVERCCPLDWKRLLDKSGLLGNGSLPNEGTAARGTPLGAPSACLLLAPAAPSEPGSGARSISLCHAAEGKLAGIEPWLTGA